MSRLSNFRLRHPRLTKVAVFLSVTIIIVGILFNILVSHFVETLGKVAVFRWALLALFVLLLALWIAAIFELGWYYKFVLPSYRKIRSGNASWYHRFVSMIYGEINPKAANLIIESLDFEIEQLKKKSKESDFRPDFSVRGLPPVVRRCDLDDEKLKDRSEFSIVVLQNKISLSQARNRNNELKKRLHVNLCGQDCAIYNNLGKSFLEERFLKSHEKEKHYDAGERCHQFFMGTNASPSFEVDIPGMRWASGGYLPIARWKGKKYVCLFFRDIYPIGWHQSRKRNTRIYTHSSTEKRPKN